MMIKKFLFAAFFILLAKNTSGQTEPYIKDSVQSLFLVGKITSLKGNVACYRLNGLRENGSYGYCIYDADYKPCFSGEGVFMNAEKGVHARFTNSRCYTIIPPVFDYALPFSENWGAVCKDKKWTYVSIDGTLMCDFVLDAAYPFKNDSAKVLYKGETYVINNNGEGLPSEINRNTTRINRKLQFETVNQLLNECQYEKALERGEALYKNILESHCELQDVVAYDLTLAIRAKFVAMAAMNQLKSATLQHNPIAYDHLENIDIHISAESGHYELNKYNSDAYFNLLCKKYSSDEVVAQVRNMVDERNYKFAILLYERWLKGRNIIIEKSAVELMVYYYLAELSDDFETANKLLIPISGLYENHGFDCLDDDYMCGSLMLNIRKYKSADSRLKKAVAAAKRRNDYVTEAISCYNLAILYSIVGNNQLCASYFEQAFCIIQEKDEFSPEIANGIMADYLDFILENEMWSKMYCGLFENYIASEIDYNIGLFTENDIQYVNRRWGKGLRRFDKILQHLSECGDEEFLRMALRLAVFKQSIAVDAEKAFITAINETEDEKIKLIIADYLKLKTNFRGYDIFSADELDMSNKELAREIARKERDIKIMLKSEGRLNIENVYISLFEDLKDSEVVIDVVSYKKDAIKEYVGAFLVKGKDLIEFVLLGEINSFSVETFWPAILKNCSVNAQDQCYLYAGKLNGFGLEYEDTGNGEIAYSSYDIHRIASLSTFNNRNEPLSFKTISLFGGMDYGEELVARNRGAMDSGYLEYSKKEVDDISSLLEEKMVVKVYSGKKGTTDVFLSIDTLAPDIIHVATHGYQKNLNVLEFKSMDHFLNYDRFNYYRQNTDVESLEWLMSNTGLFFSLSEKDSVNVLYSREVALCNFSKSKLVVLSACSTLKGEVSDQFSEHISLTTAFVITQAKNIITSLNDVDDWATCEFMTAFYDKLSNTCNIYDSFKNTVFEMKTKYPNNKLFWSSFVLLEN